MDLIHILEFALAGILLKMADKYGEERNSLIGYASAFAAASLFWLLVNVDHYTSTAILAVVIGCIASLKVDRWNLAAGLALLVALMVIIGLEFPVLPALTALSVAAYLDEAGHDRPWRMRYVKLLFRYRFFLKGVAVLLAVIGLLNMLSAVGLITFDISYEVAGAMLKRGRSTVEAD
ncbi:MAG: hypothetical protein QXJ75_00810 [Candidatus Bathyarchaeia archaeon]